jgi:hypothetical protein
LRSSPLHPWRGVRGEVNFQSMNKINITGELYPRKLSEEEIDDPYLVIHQFFDYSDLPNIREYLWEWLKTTVSGTFSTELLKKYKRHDMIYFYEHIEKLIEAAHLIYLQKKAKQKKEDAE